MTDYYQGNDQAKPKRAWRTLLLGIRTFFPALFLLISGVIIYLNREILGDIDQQFSILLLAATGLFLTSRVINSLALYFLLRDHAANLDKKTLIYLDLSSSLLNYLPFKPGLFAKAIFLKQSQRIGFQLFGFSIIYLNIVQLFAACFLALISASALMTGMAALYEQNPTSLLLLFFAGLMVPAYIFLPTILEKAQAVLAKTNFSLSKAKQMRSIFPNGPASALQGGLAFLMGILITLRLQVCFFAIGESVPLVTVLFLAMIAVPARLITFIPGGVGIRETLIVLGGTLIGLPLTTTLTAASLDRLVQFVSLLIFGSVSSIMLSHTLPSSAPENNAP